MGFLCLIAISAIAWNTRYVVKDYKEAKRLVFSNQIAELSLQLSSQLAYERGFTATILAGKDAPVEIIEQQLAKERKNSDNLYGLFIIEIQGVINLLESQVIYQNIAKLNRFREQQLKLRSDIDRQLSLQDAENNKLSEQWISSLKDFIEQVRLLRQMIMAPSDSRDFAIYYSLIVKEIFHSFTESMGLQRVIIGQALMAQRPLKKTELDILLTHENLLQVVEQKLSSVLQFFPPSQEIQEAREVFVNSFHLQYKNLYRDILVANEQNKPYPISAFEWFSQATQSIDSVLKFSLAIDNQMYRLVLKIHHCYLMTRYF